LAEFGLIVGGPSMSRSSVEALARNVDVHQIGDPATQCARALTTA